ncbi:MAG: HDIG domain-containing metalloprotein, partial [Phycisphaerae bacterium]
AGVGLYVLMYQPRVVQNPARSVALGALLLVMLLVCRMIEMLGTARGAAAEWTVLPVVMTGAILSIAYNQRFALGVTGAFCILATMAVSGGLELFVVLLVVAGVTVFMLAEVRTRLKILEVGGLSAVAAFAAVFFVGLMGRQELSYIIEHAGWAALAGLVAALLIQAILPLIERLFGIVTAMTLLEWCDVNKPLLKRLAQEAPGTYNHSLVLGSLAEAAAEQIGANGLLVRVGAYYHDIGKINKPDYFVENYQSQTDRHEKLSPTMSLLIIVGHVKDGIEMAREYGLPPVLHQFIAEHHGTTVVQYFYHAAAERRQAEGKGGVAEAEFRYPGPTPRSKESAILMLCDGVEGAVRALQEPTPGRIEATVHQIAMQRLMDGQLDDCDITLKELERVEESLVKSLCAIYHGRISYPRAAAVAQRGSRTA